MARGRPRRYRDPTIDSGGSMSDEFGLAGKVAIVTGGGAPDDGIGNGRAAAMLLARSGAKVLVVDIEREAAAQTVKMIEAEGGAALAHVADVSDEVQCKALVDAALTAWGRLDLLDNNVGIGGRGSVVDTPSDLWRRVMTVNVDSMFYVSKHAIPAMIETAGGGAIVNVSSISALRPRGLTAYSTSKGAVIALTRAMAVDHGPQQIRVNCVAPGPIYTPRMYTGQMTPAGRESAHGLGAGARRARLGYWPRGAFPAQRAGALHHRANAGGRWRRGAGGAVAHAGNVTITGTSARAAALHWHRVDGLKPNSEQSQCARFLRL
jgi:NAD(P)-dependent dehydrogenase (short-subunit alcohol dehydrogenase family)